MSGNKNKKNNGKDIVAKDVSMCGVACELLEITACDNLKTVLEKLCAYLADLGGGGEGGNFLKYRINSDGTGTPDATFDGYLAEGLTVTIPAISGKVVGPVIINKTIYQDFADDGNKLSLSGSVLDLTNMGGVFDGDWLIVFFK